MLLLKESFITYLCNLMFDELILTKKGKLNIKNHIPTSILTLLTSILSSKSNNRKHNKRDIIPPI